jgi:hypothetical protein
VERKCPWFLWMIYPVIVQLIHYCPYSALHAFPVKFFTPVDPLLPHCCIVLVIHCIVYLNYYSIFAKLYDIYHIVIHTFAWELHIEKYRIECGRSRSWVRTIMFVFCRRYNAANPNPLLTMIQGQAFSINLTIPIMRTSISISCERARKL